MGTLDELIRCIDDANDEANNRAYELVADLVDTQDKTLSPDLINALRKYVVARNPYGRDVIATAYAEIEGIDALPILLRASSVDMGDDKEALREIIVDTISLDPAQARSVVEELSRDANPRIQSVAKWAGEMVDFVSDN